MKLGRRTKVMSPSCTKQILLWHLIQQFCDLLAPYNLLFLTKDCLNLEHNKLVFMPVTVHMHSLLSILYYDHVSSLITHNAYGEVQGCPVQGQQCYHHQKTRYLIFENVLIVYGIILESMGVT